MPFHLCLAYVSHYDAKAFQQFRKENYSVFSEKPTKKVGVALMPSRSAHLHSEKINTDHTAQRFPLPLRLTLI